MFNVNEGVLYFEKVLKNPSELHKQETRVPACERV